MSKALVFLIVLVCLSSYRWVYISLELFYFVSLTSSCSLTPRGAGIAQWLERRTRDRKVLGSSPGRSGGRIFFSRVNILCWLLFRYPFHPRVTADPVKRLLKVLKDPGHSAKSAGGGLQLNTHIPYLCGFEWSDTVKDPGHSAKSAGGGLQLNTHTPYLCGFEWSDTVNWYMVEWWTQNLRRNGSISRGTSHAIPREHYQYTISMDIKGKVQGF